MPRVAKELSALAVKNMKHSGKSKLPERCFVGGVSGLQLQISPNGAKSWLLHTTIGDKRCYLGVGGYPEKGLAKAREDAAAMKDQIKKGVDPREERRKAKAALAAQATFGQVLEEFLASKLADKGPKSQHQWRYTLEAFASPVLGPLDVNAIDVPHILKILEPIWHDKTETASRVRGRIESVLNYAIATKRRKNTFNPAKWGGNLDQILPSAKRIKKVTHHPALQIDDVPTWFAKLKTHKSISARALAFAALTAARSGEVRGALWGEIDFKRKLWIVPAQRMKMKKEHRVPLADQALQLLQSLPRFEGSQYVFPAAMGGQLSDMALSELMRGMHERAFKKGGKGWVDTRSGRPAVPHGLRSTFRQWAAERTNHPREVCEACLAHDVRGAVEAAYQRSDHLEKRRAVLQQWADFLEGKR